MSRKAAPNPAAFSSLGRWAEAVFQYLGGETRIKDRNDPLPVLLPHQTGDERAAVDGILMWDPVSGQPVVSKNGAWVKLALDT